MNYFSRYDYLYLIKYKYEILEKFKKYKNKVKRQIGKYIKIVNLDRKDEYTSNGFIEYYKKSLIDSQINMPRIPQ